MSFEIQYDKDGYPLKNASMAKELEEKSEQAMAQVREASSRIEPEEAVQVNSEPELESAPEQPVPAEEQQSRYEEQPIESNKERNMRILREAKESADKERQRANQERDDAIRRAEDLERRYKKSEQVPVDDGDDFNIGEDDLAEGKHLKKVYKEVKELKKQVEYYKNNAQSQNVESRIRSEFPDFANVVTPENITILKHLKPRQSALLDQSNDIYETAATAYEMIKEYVIPKEDIYAQQKQVAQKNAAKPKPVASLSPQQGDSPLSKANAFANGLTPELMKQMQKEMADAMRGR